MAGKPQDNLFGTGKSASLNVSRSKVTQSANLSFTDPYFTPDGVSMTYSLFGSRYDPSKLLSTSTALQLPHDALRRHGNHGHPDYRIRPRKLWLGVEHWHMGVTLLRNPPYRYQRFVDENKRNNWIYKGLLSWYRNTTDDGYWPTRGC